MQSRPSSPVSPPPTLHPTPHEAAALEDAQLHELGQGQLQQAEEGQVGQLRGGEWTKGRGLSPQPQQQQRAGTARTGARLHWTPHHRHTH